MTDKDDMDKEADREAKALLARTGATLSRLPDDETLQMLVAAGYMAGRIRGYTETERILTALMKGE